MFRVILVSGLLVGFVCCRSGDSTAAFRDTIWGDFREAKAHLDAYKQVILVCVYEDHWEDRGPHEYSFHHFRSSVVRTYKGDWKISEKAAFVHGVDDQAKTAVNAVAGELIFLFTDAHTNAEFGVMAGDFVPYDSQTDRLLQLIFSNKKALAGRGLPGFFLTPATASSGLADVLF
jgi:hypothetical protein